MRLEDVIGYQFKNPDILNEALTHSSYASEHKMKACNERLEFLGDAVAGLITAHYLYHTEQDCSEGKLAKLKGKLVSRRFFAIWAREVGLGNALSLGQGELGTGGRDRDSILSNAMEAVLGAVFLDGGYKAAEQILNNRLSQQPLEGLDADYKSALQETVQKKYKVPPDYELLSTMGPEHNKVFTVEVRMKKRVLGRGRGKNKKQAEQDAAKAALENLGQEQPLPGQD
ncbi:MAG: ribonuclease III [Elusimicrobiaceae bacterium]|nr:ribonuclease III [Elusimicrobiaceae bacterium]